LIGLDKFSVSGRHAVGAGCAREEGDDESEHQ
jgi:hypothetical protein